jgi:hypothetical protein
MKKHVLSMVLVCAVAGSHGAAQSPATRESEIKVEHLPAQTALIRTVRGGYDQHPAVIGDLMAYAGRLYAGQFTVGDSVFGVYATDPDAVVSPADLTWEIGMVLTVAPESARTPDAPYVLTSLPATDAAVLDSDMANTAIDGLSMSRWMLENGYVQMAPTRMAYIATDGNPQHMRTRIMIPVRKRPSGLILPPRR